MTTGKNDCPEGGDCFNRGCGMSHEFCIRKGKVAMNTEEPKHTPTPWESTKHSVQFDPECNRYYVYVNKGIGFLERVYGESAMEAIENADFQVEAVNNYASLQSQLKELTEERDKLKDDLNSAYKCNELYSGKIQHDKEKLAASEAENERLKELQLPPKTIDEIAYGMFKTDYKYIGLDSCKVVVLEEFIQRSKSGKEASEAMIKKLVDALELWKDLADEGGQTKNELQVLLSEARQHIEPKQPTI